MTLVQLNEVLEELDQTVKEYSEVLVQQLALREDLDYEKETKNSFISALLSVQNKVKGRSGTGNNGATKQKVKQDPLSLLSNKLKLKNGIEPGMVSGLQWPQEICNSNKLLFQLHNDT